MAKIITTKDNKIFYDEVNTTEPSLTKDQIFIKIRQWFVENFMESKNVLEVNDIQNGLLTGKGTYKYSKINGLNVHSGYVMFVMNVAVKDGKFRYQLYDFTASDNNQSMLTSQRNYSIDVIDLNDILKMYKSGKREKYARKFLDDMLALVYKVQKSLSDLSMNTSSITDF